MRMALVIVSFLPFLYYGAKDNAFHFRGRKVGLTEHLMHLGIGVAEAAILVQALLGNLVLMFVALGLFMASGAIDEYIFHHGLPEEESDLHAKGHLALFLFVVVAIATISLERNHWHWPSSATVPGTPPWR